jgi:hypothetical protein
MLPLHGAWCVLNAVWLQPCSVLMSKNSTATALLPANAAWDDEIPTCEWRCKFNFDLNPIATLCCERKKASLPVLPTNAVWNATSCDFTCKFGYFGPACKLCSEFSGENFDIATINFGASFVAENNSYFLPPHAKWVDFAANCTWQCLKDYTITPSPTAAA